MPELDARIRDYLDFGRTRLTADRARVLTNALFAVLGLHRPVFYETNLCMTCSHCRDGQPFPCPTVETIAKELGVTDA